MRRRLLLGLEAFGLPTLVFVIALALAPGRAALITHVYVVVVVGGILVAIALRLAASLGTHGPRTFERGLVRAAGPGGRVHQLEQLEREVTLGSQSAWDLHSRLARTLREIAGPLLATRRGIDLEREPDRAAAALGPDAWELVRPDRTAPRNRHEPGIELERLDRAVAALEAL